MQDQELIYP